MDFSSSACHMGSRRPRAVTFCPDDCTILVCTNTKMAKKEKKVQEEGDKKSQGDLAFNGKLRARATGGPMLTENPSACSHYRFGVLVSLDTVA